MNNLLKEYLFLSYKPEEGVSGRIFDIKVGDLTILRECRGDLCLHILKDGTSILLPHPWYHFGIGFYRYGGRLLSDTENKFLNTYLNFLSGVDNKDGSVILRYLYQLCEIGTKGFIEEVKEYISLRPFEYNSAQQEGVLI